MDLSDDVNVDQMDQSRLQCEDGCQTQEYYVNGSIFANCMSVSKHGDMCTSYLENEEIAQEQVKWESNWIENIPI